MITGQALYWSFVALIFCVAMYNLVGKSTTRKDVFASIAVIIGLLLLLSPLLFPDSGLYTDNTVVGAGR